MVPPKGIRHFQWLFCFSFVLLSVSLARAGNPDVIKASRHTVKGGALAGVRWYEIRNPSAPFVYQQSTIIDPNVNYWLGSIAMDKTGNVALGFSASSRACFQVCTWPAAPPTMRRA